MYLLSKSEDNTLNCQDSAPDLARCYSKMFVFNNFNRNRNSVRAS